jgi:hypothetical protein
MTAKQDCDDGLAHVLIVFVAVCLLEGGDDVI